MSVPGVGPITALAFRATIDRPDRFRRSVHERALRRSQAAGADGQSSANCNGQAIGVPSLTSMQPCIRAGAIRTRLPMHGRCQRQEGCYVTCSHAPTISHYPADRV